MILGEIATLALLCAVGAAVPQVGSATPAELARLHDSGPVVAALLKLLPLDHVFRSVPFLALSLLAAASLTIVVIEQISRLRQQWSQRLSPAHFQNAPFRAEFESEAALEFPAGASDNEVRIWSERRIGLLGSPMFHLGLLAVIVAGAFKALFGADAVVDLLEGETLPPGAAAWSAQFPGVLAGPIRLETPVTLKAVKAARYRDGDLRELKIHLETPRAGGTQTEELAVNRDLRLDGQRLFLGSDFGPAALLEWQNPTTNSVREAALLAEKGAGNYEGASTGPGGLVAHLRAHVNRDGQHPAQVEVRVMKDNALLFTGDAHVGDMIALPGGIKLALHGTPFWARLRGNRDAALGLAYAGFALVMAGATLIFTVVKLDFCVVVSMAGERRRVFVALKPQRFAPLFQERFDRLLRKVTEAKQNARDTQNTESEAASAAATPFAPLAFPPTRAAGKRLACWLLLLGAALLMPGCQRASFDEARELVERYNTIVSEAYRRGDVKLIDPVVGPREGKKLTGLIGVRLDLGITLDSELLSLEITGAEKEKDEMRVQTRERWRYRDRKIGTGEQVGEESVDSYEMLYVFKKIDKAWLVDEIKFTSPPQVGRKQGPWIADRKQAHGMMTQTNAMEARQP